MEKTEEEKQKQGLFVLFKQRSRSQGTANKLKVNRLYDYTIIMK